MTTVCLATHTHKPHLAKLDKELNNLVLSHNYEFNEIQIVLQRCGHTDLNKRGGINYIVIEESDYPIILGKFGIPHKDKMLSDNSHGWNAPHYYEHHCVNHCAHILNTASDYIVFNDADCKMIRQPEGQSWINYAIDILEYYPEVFIVAPSEGGSDHIRLLPDGVRFTNTVSQQLFIGRTKQLKEMNLNFVKLIVMTQN